MVACPTCGKELTYIPQYDRWYCYAEAKYAPKDFGRTDAPLAKQPEATPTASVEAPATESHEGHYHCPSCGKELTFITQYGRYYCYAEGKYAPRDIQPIAAVRVEPPGISAAVETPALAVTPAEAVPTAVSPEPAPAEGAPKETPPEVTQEPTPTLEPVEQPGASPDLGPPIAVSTETPPEASGPPKPELKRDAVTKAKKTRLLEWCKAYGLDTSGPRTALRDRLLQYMDEHHLDETEEEAAEEVEEALEAVPSAAPETIPAAEPVAPAVPTTPKPTPVVEPEPVIERAAEPEPEPTPVPEAKPAGVEETRPVPAEILPTETKREAVPASASGARVETPPAAMEPPKLVPTPSPTPPAPALEVEKALPCPTCGKDLTYIAQYDRLYCYAEGKYAPKDYGKAAAAAPAPPVVEAPRPAAPAPVVIVPPVVVQVPRVEPKAANPCPTCGRELRYVKDYDRWWCDAEKKYAPKEYGKAAKPACPTCGKDLTWIPEYGRWYCYAEFKYAPKTMAAPTAAALALERGGPMPAAPALRIEPAVAARAETAAVVSGMVRAEHRHGAPWAGVALATTGFALLLLAFLFTTVNFYFNFVPFPGTLEAFTLYMQIMTILQLIGLLLAMIGVAVGLSSVRSRGAS